MKLSAYYFACGYVEVLPATRGETVRVWREHGTYHARRSDWRGNPDLWVTSRALARERQMAAPLCKL